MKITTIVLLVVALWAQPGAATTRFTGLNLHVFCDIEAVDGRHELQASRYTARGTCVEVETAPEMNRGRAGQSQFDDVGRSREKSRAPWTAEGVYDPARREARETITIPPPRIDEKLAVTRPYGRITTVMTCDRDPWLETTEACRKPSVTRTETMNADIEKMLTFQPRPFTARMKPLQNEALWQAKRSADARLATSAKQSPATTVRYGASEPPRIVDPRAGSTHAPQTAMKIRVAAPKIVGLPGYKVQSYDLVFERRQPSGEWKPLTQVGAPASEAEGIGYVGWGAQKPGTPNQMTAAPGTYRVRADVNTPRQQKLPELNRGPWTEFVVAGEPAKDPLRVQAAPRITGTQQGAMAQPPSSFRR